MAELANALIGSINYIVQYVPRLGTGPWLPGPHRIDIWPARLNLAFFGIGLAVAFTLLRSAGSLVPLNKILPEDESTDRMSGKSTTA